MAANCHPDHDTICTFRRNNFGAVTAAFLEVLLLAKELKLLRVGTVSVDGTKVDANANKRNSIRYDRAGELREQLRVEIKGLLDRAERDDADAGSEPQGLPEELKRRETLKAKLDKARAELERRAQSRADSEREEYERKVEAREQREGSRKGKPIKAPAEEPRDEEQVNLTDADSSLMRKSRRHEYRQAYNAQAAVDADGSQLVLGSRVSVSASDRNELVADVDSMPGALGSPDRVLADAGYATGSEVSELEGRGVEVLVATGAEGQRRRHDFRPEPPPKPAKEPRAIKAMQEKMELPENRAPTASQAYGGAGVRDREAGDGLSQAARRREGGGRMEAGDAGLQLPTPAQADVGLTGGGRTRRVGDRCRGRKGPLRPSANRWRDTTAATTHLNSHSGHRSTGAKPLPRTQTGCRTIQCEGDVLEDPTRPSRSAAAHYASTHSRQSSAAA